MRQEPRTSAIKRSTLFLLTTAAGFVCLCQTQPAAAEEVLTNRWFKGDTEITIGYFAEWPWPGQVAVHKVGSGPNAACLIENLGPATGLDSDWAFYGNYRGSSFNHKVNITAFTTEIYCGDASSIVTLSPLLYNGHYFDLRGGNGDNRMYSGYGETWMWGEGGNDILYSLNPTANLSGWDGNDVLITGNGSGNGEVLWGGPGDDCLQDSSSSAATFDCGDGYDRYTGTPVSRVGCETRVSQCIIP